MRETIQPAGYYCARAIMIDIHPVVHSTPSQGIKTLIRRVCLIMFPLIMSGNAVLSFWSADCTTDIHVADLVSQSQDTVLERRSTESRASSII